MSLYILAPDPAGNCCDCRANPCDNCSSNCFLFLPVSIGDWYINCATAYTVMIDPLQVSNCVGFSENNIFTPYTSFVANGGSSLQLTASSFTTTSANTGNMWGSISAIINAVITATTDGNFIQLIIYDDVGTIIFSDFVFSTSITSTPLPYTGCYTVCVVSAGPPFVTSSITVTVTSSSTLSTNPVRALYDIGLSYPGTLDCGETCP